MCPHAQQEGRRIHTEKAQEETASRPWLQYGASLWAPIKKRDASLSAVNRGTRPALKTRGPTWTRELGAMSQYTDLGFLGEGED